MLILRVSAIATRPLCILAEKFMVGESGLLPLLLSIGSIVFISTSIPLHMEYYKSDLKSKSRKKEYVSSLSIALLTVALLLLLFASIFFSVKFSIIIASFFVIEKLADELARENEYHRKYLYWIGIQFYKSLWLILALILFMFFRSYEDLMLLSGLFFAFIIIVGFYSKQREWPIIERNSLRLIKNASKFILGNTLGSLYQQAPRVIVATYLPSAAHIFTLVGQVLQAINLLFDTKYIARNRRIMSLKTEAFYKPFMKSIVYVNITITLLIILFTVIYFYKEIDIGDERLRSIAVFLIQLADGILYLYISFIFGYFQWTSRKINITRIFSLGILLYLPFILTMLVLAQKSEGWWFVGINNIAGVGLLTYFLLHIKCTKI